MLWILLAAALGGAIIGGLYLRALVVVMTSAQIALFMFALFLSTPLSVLDLALYLMGSLAAHQIAYFLAFTLRLYFGGSLEAEAPTSLDGRHMRGITPAVGERFDEVVVLAGEIERRAPQVRKEAANVARLVREIRFALDERRANFR